MDIRWKPLAVVAILLTASSCGGGDDDSSTTSTSQAARIIATTVPVATVPVATAPAVETTAAPTTVSTGVSNYTIESGDTLSVLAGRFGVSTADIMAINGITDPNRVSVGQVLVIPAPGTAVNTASTAATTSDNAPAAVADGGSYTVGDGESLGFIAIKFNTTVAAIVAANNLTDPDRVGAGDTLIIPAG